MKQNFHRTLLLAATAAALAAGTGGQANGQELQAADPTGPAAKAFAQGDSGRAADFYRQYLDQHPGDAAAACDLAAVRLDQDQSRAAVDALQRSGVRGPALGEACLADGEIDRAVFELNRSLGAAGPQWRTRLLLGLVCLLQGRQAEAVEYCWQALHEDKRQPAVRQLLGWSFQALGRKASAGRDYFFMRAQEELTAALRVDASLWSVHYDLALLAESRGRWREALRAWDALAGIIGPGPLIQAAVARVQQQVEAVPAATSSAAGRVAEGAGSGWRLKNLNRKPLSGGHDPVMRVGLADQLDHLAFGCSRAWSAVDERGRLFWQGQGQKIYRLERLPSGRWALKNRDGKVLKRLPRKVVLAPVRRERTLALLQFYQSSGYFWGGGARGTRYYRGRIEITPNRKSLRVVNLIRLEDYLASLVPAEMPAFWPPEALKAQAIVARTDALNRRGTHTEQNYDVCNTPHCAQYDGVASEDPRTTLALTSTRGLRLYQGDKPALTYYSHACGGLTQDKASAWDRGNGHAQNPSGVYDGPGNSTAGRSLPLSPSGLRAWLASEPDVWCAHPRYAGKANFRWVKILTPEQALLLGGPDSPLGRLRQIRIKARSWSGYVRELEIIGDQGATLLQGDRVRTCMGGLRSNLFTILPIRLEPGRAPAAWVFIGGGWGHGVGFCQAGAGAMGEAGYSHQEILEHYFPGGRIGE